MVGSGRVKARADVGRVLLGSSALVGAAGQVGAVVVRSVAVVPLRVSNLQESRSWKVSGVAVADAVASVMVG